MRDSGVREDDPEYIKAHQLVMALKQQQYMNRLKNEQMQQQQQQAQLAKKRPLISQPNAAEGQHLTNGVGGMSEDKRSRALPS